MEDALALIRLLAESPGEVPPLARTRDLMDESGREKIVREGIPAGDSVLPIPVHQPSAESFSPASPAAGNPVTGPPANMTPSPGVLGQGVRWVLPSTKVESSVSITAPRTEEGGRVTPVISDREILPVANPVTGIPSVGTPVDVHVLPPAPVHPADVMTPETFVGRAVTPNIVRAIEGVHADVRQSSYVRGEASPTPSTTVTVTVPPAFPIDPEQAFAQVDAEVRLPPPAIPEARDMRVMVPEDSPPSETVAARQSAIYSDERTERWTI